MQGNITMISVIYQVGGFLQNRTILVGIGSFKMLGIVVGGGVNHHCPWPVSSQDRVVGANNVTFDPDDLNIFQHFGCYFQGKGKITIGKGTWIAPNVGLITANHCVDNLEEHEQAADIVIGENCWIGMNSMILPGVTLGNKTVVGAGSVVTKSFPHGNCIIAGNPARVLRELKVTI